jgi:hypothetical protein
MTNLNDMPDDVLLQIFQIAAEMGIAKRWNVRRDTYNWTRFGLLCKRFQLLILQYDSPLRLTFDACASHKMLNRQIKAYGPSRFGDMPLQFKMIVPCKYGSTLLDFLDDISHRITKFVIRDNNIPTNNNSQSLNLSSVLEIDLHRTSIPPLGFPIASNLTSLSLTSCTFNWTPAIMLRTLASLGQMTMLRMEKNRYILPATWAPPAPPANIPSLVHLTLDCKQLGHRYLLEALYHEDAVHNITTLHVLAFPANDADKSLCMTRSKSILRFTVSSVTLWVYYQGDRVMQGPCPLRGNTHRTFIAPTGDTWWFQYFDPHITEVLFTDEHQLDWAKPHSPTIRVVGILFPFDRTTPKFHLAQTVMAKYEKAVELVLCPTQAFKEDDVVLFWRGFDRWRRSPSELKYISVCGGPPTALELVRQHQTHESIGCPVIRYTEFPVSVI